MIAPEEWVAAVAATMRAERSARRMTQDDLAHRAGLSRATVIRFEAGERVPDVEQMARVAAVFDLSLSGFVELAGTRTAELTSRNTHTGPLDSRGPAAFRRTTHPSPN